MPLTRGQESRQARTRPCGTAVACGTAAPVAAPPRVGPGAPLFCPSRRRVGADAGALGARHLPIALAGGAGLRRHGIPSVLQAPGVPPAGAAARHRAPGARALRHVAPGGAGAPPPYQAVGETAAVARRSAGLRLLGGQQRLQPRPVGVGAVAPGQRMQQHTRGGRVRKYALVREAEGDGGEMG
jgi:hypothetical protein